MGTANFSVRAYGTDRSGSVLSSTYRTGGAFTTSEAEARNLEDASGDISLTHGEVLEVHASEAMRIRFGGTAATATTGHYLPAAAQERFEIGKAEEGTVSAMDVA